MACTQCNGKKKVEVDHGRTSRLVLCHCALDTTDRTPDPEINCMINRPPSKFCESGECTRRHDIGFDYRLFTSIEDIDAAWVFYRQLEKTHP